MKYHFCSKNNLHFSAGTVFTLSSIEVTQFGQAPVASVHQGLKKFQKQTIQLEILHKICPRWSSTQYRDVKNITLMSERLK